MVLRVTVISDLVVPFDQWTGSDEDFSSLLDHVREDFAEFLDHSTWDVEEVVIETTATMGDDRGD